MMERTAANVESARSTTLEHFAQALFDRYVASVPLESSLNLSLEEGYEVQEQLVGKLTDLLGLGAAGWKVGLTSSVSQKQFDAEGPVFGRLLGAPVLPSGAIVRLQDFIAPRLECELAFGLGDELPAPVARIEDVLQATAWVAPAFEIVDSRVQDWKVDLGTLVADNSCFGRAVIGRRISNIDRGLDRLGVVLRRCGSACGQGMGADVLGHPARSVAWLANELCRRGQKLAVGDIVLAGSFLPPVIVASGDVFEADFDDFGSVQVRFG